MGLLVSLGLETKEFTKGLKLAQRDFSALGGELKKIGSSLSISVTAPIAGAAAAVFGFSTDAKDAFKEFGESVKTSLGAVGDDLARTIDLKGALIEMAAGVDTVTTAFTDLPKPAKVAIVSIAATAAAMGPAILMAGQLTIAIGALKSVLGGPVGLILTLASAGVALAGFVMGMNRTSDATKEASSSISGEVAMLLKKKKDLEDEYARSRYAGFTTAPLSAEQEAKHAEAMRKVNEEIKNATALQRDYNAQSAEYEKLLDGFAARMTEVAAEFRLTGDEEAKLNAESRLLVDLYKDLSRLSLRVPREDLEALAKDAKGVAESLAEVKREASMTRAMRDLGLQAGAREPSITDKMRAYRGVRVEEIRSGKLSPEQAEAANAEVKALDKSLDSVSAHLVDLVSQVPSLAKQIAGLIWDTFNQISTGIGNAVAQIIVYGADAGEVFIALGKQILASVIASIITMGVQYIVTALLGIAATSALFSEQLGSAAAMAFANAYASTCAIPIVGPFLAPGVAAGALGGVLGGSAGAFGAGMALGKGLSAGGGAIAAAAQGGIFTKPHIIAEAGPPEIALTKKNVRDFLGAGGEQATEQTIIFQVNDRVIAKAAAKGMPRVLRLQGART